VVTPETLIVNPQDVYVDTSKIADAVISGGTAPYIIDTNPSNQIDTSIARAQITGAILTITGVRKGTTSVTVRDAFSKTAEVEITVN
jgi:hypothetical protein